MAPFLNYISNIFSTSFVDNGFIIGVAALTGLWSLFVGVVVFRLFRRFWIWLNLAEFRKGQSWQSGSSKPMPVEVAKRSQAKWRGLLITAYGLAAFTVVAFGLFANGYAYQGTVAVFILVIFLIGTLVYAFAG
jgi:hypothetical protein